MWKLDPKVLSFALNFLTNFLESMLPCIIDALHIRRFSTKITSSQSHVLQMITRNLRDPEENRVAVPEYKVRRSPCPVSLAPPRTGQYRLQVPLEFPTIQLAVDFAKEGGRVVLADGVDPTLPASKFASSAQTSPPPNPSTLFLFLSRSILRISDCI